MYAGGPPPRRVRSSPYGGRQDPNAYYSYPTDGTGLDSGSMQAPRYFPSAAARVHHSGGYSGGAGYDRQASYEQPPRGERMQQQYGDYPRAATEDPESIIITQGLPIPQHKIAWIVGKRGSYIRQLEKKSGAAVRVSDDTSTEFGHVWKYLMMRGTCAALSRCKKLIQIRLDRIPLENEITPAHGAGSSEEGAGGEGFGGGGEEGLVGGDYSADYAQHSSAAGYATTGYEQTASSYQDHYGAHGSAQDAYADAHPDSYGVSFDPDR